MQNVVLAPPRLQWGDKVNLLIVAIFQVTAIAVLISVPFLIDDWGAGESITSSIDRWLFLYIPYLLGLIFLASSIWVFSQRRDDAAGRTYALFAALISINLFCLSDVVTTRRLLSIWIVTGSLSGGALINLALVFPDQIRLNFQHASSRYLGYLPSGVLILLTAILEYFSGSVDNFAIISLLQFIFITLALLFFFFSTLIRRFGSPSPIVREQSRLILWGFSLAFIPPLGMLLLDFGISRTMLVPQIFISLSAFPISLTYTLLRYKSLGEYSLLKRTIVYGALLVCIAGCYALLVSGLSLIVNTRLDFNHPFLVGAVVFLLALLVSPLKAQLQSRVDAAFHKGSDVYQANLQSLGHRLSRTTEIDRINELVRASIDQVFSPSRFYIYTIDQTNNYYIATPDAAGSSSSEIHFARSGALVDMLARQSKTIYLGSTDKFPDDLLVDQARIAVLQAELFVPMLGQAGMIGWLALGSKGSGEPYSIDDIHHLELICDQVSIAIERSQVITVLEKRIHDMDTITKVAEQVNQELALDNLLEMFYRETRSLVPTVDFRITLKAELGDVFHHVFYISDNNRLVRRENQPFLAKQSLERNVIQNQHPIVTDDYPRECQRRGLSAESKEIHAWMSVPLIASEETIGAVCVGSRDPGIAYQSEQVNLLQAVADLVAGAIVKTRLLDESQKQAHQMATINELTRSLTSTLELDPLLNRIMEGAVEILDSEAGSLLLVDQETGESVFEVAVGPVGSHLIGHRLPPGVGIVGRVINAKQAIIENDVRSSEDWFNADQETGFSSKDLLVVPLLVKDEVIGVLEVLNKRDGSPFSNKDLELLSAFAGQMAVAIENARLYTQTDQALAARVDELSIMQRIDQQLNASLDIEHVMSLTLESAMRHTQATAGFIGSMANGDLQVVVAQGFHTGQVEAGDLLAGEHLPGLAEILNHENAQPVTIRFAALDLEEDKNNGDLTNPEGIKQWDASDGMTGFILVPIRREGELNSIICLATTSPALFRTEDIEFLSRLSDHASIAISNARLYAEIQAANIAKSEFVSAAAHELKNPLTSIKGYSDLLVAGTVGSVNEGQVGFLKTIRANAERMRTLVSDLQDISRIEAGQLALNFRSQSLDEILKEVISSFETQIAARDQELVVKIDNDLPPTWCDITRVVQVLTNLVSNAHKYSPSGSVIVVSAQQIRQPQDHNPDTSMIQVSVIDQGFGISQEDQKHLFEQFFRSEDSRVRESTGTGLGLSITKRLVEIQGGKLWFESVLGKGSTFYFTLPAAENI